MIGRVISVLALVATLCAFYNVYGDNSELQARAQTLACGANPCVKLLRTQRTPIRQWFTFQTNLNSSRTRDVHCSRSLLLVGAYECNVTDSAP
jgi:hypothetical protein